MYGLISELSPIVQLAIWFGRFYLEKFVWGRSFYHAQKFSFVFEYARGPGEPLHITLAGDKCKPGVANAVEM